MNERNFTDHTAVPPVHRATKYLENAFSEVGNSLSQATLEITETIEEPRLTEYMREQLDGDGFPSPDLLAILNTIDPSFADQILKRTAELQSSKNIVTPRSPRSFKSMGRAILRGMSFSAFPQDFTPGQR